MFNCSSRFISIPRALFTLTFYLLYYSIYHNTYRYDKSKSNFDRMCHTNENKHDYSFHSNDLHSKKFSIFYSYKTLVLAYLIFRVGFQIPFFGKRTTIAAIPINCTCSYPYAWLACWPTIAHIRKDKQDTF